MKTRSALGCMLMSFSLSASSSAEGDAQGQQGAIKHDVYFAAPACSTLLITAPLTTTIAELGPNYGPADVTDIAVEDFNGDGRADFAAAWYANDETDRFNNLRALSVFFGQGDGTFVFTADYDLYVPHAYFEALSIFRNGTAEIGAGDFDGDGDPDIAVTSHFGDELWFLENDGAGGFTQHQKFPFGFNTTGNFQVSPEALAADFDGDGRDELAYLADPIQYIQGLLVHFWTTSGSIADMSLIKWEGINPEAVQWTRGLALADVNGDQRPDLCFTGSVNPPEEDDPVLVFWYGLDLESRTFNVHMEYPTILCSDATFVRPTDESPLALLLTDIDGVSVQYWEAIEEGVVDFVYEFTCSSYSGLSEDFGMAVETADVDGDGDVDFVTRQKHGTLCNNKQVEVTLYYESGMPWRLVNYNPISSRGFQNVPYSEILRPRNLAVVDCCGNSLPEIVAAFGPNLIDPEDPEGGQILEAVIWRNSCMGDITRDGYTNLQDLSAFLGALGSHEYDPDADLDKNHVLSLSDLAYLLSDYGCDCRESSSSPPH